MLWLLASEYNDGSFDGDTKKLAFRLRCSEQEIEDGIKPLIDMGFIIVDSNMLAECKQDAMPEREGEREGEYISVPKSSTNGRAKAKKTIIREDFSISDRVKKWAEKNNHANLEKHLESFISRSKAKGYEYVDWDEAFMTAIRDNWAKIEIQPKVKFV